MPAERDERLYLADMREAVDRILRYTMDGRAAFFADPMVQDAVIRNLEVLGEAVRQVSATTRWAHPEIPWRQIVGTRDRVIHGYFTVDLEKKREDRFQSARDVAFARRGARAASPSPPPWRPFGAGDGLPSSRPWRRRRPSPLSACSPGVAGLSPSLLPVSFNREDGSLFLYEPQTCELNTLDLATGRVRLFRKVGPIGRAWSTAHPWSRLPTGGPTAAATPASRRT